MKIQVKVEGDKVIVMKEDGSVMSTWTKQLVDDMGGLEKCVERYKKANSKLQVEIIGATPAPVEPAPAPVTPAPADPVPAPVEPAPASQV